MSDSTVTSSDLALSSIKKKILIEFTGDYKYNKHRQNDEMVCKYMYKRNIYPMLQAILAAALFGASAPISKLLLGEIEPIPMAAFLYLGSGIGLLLYRKLPGIGKQKKNLEASIGIKDIKWLAGAIFSGGVFAPIVLMIGLNNSPAAIASLLLNFESAATTLIAVIVFKESIGRRIWIAIVCITTASILLSWNTDGNWGISIGALGVLVACFLWGIDNNLTRNISSKDPLSIVTVKGICAGTFSFMLALFLKNNLPDIRIILGAMVVGFFCYGLSIVLFILAMRNMGASRTSAFFGTAPFVGVTISFLLFREMPGILFLASLPLMIIGAILILSEEHGHEHIHEVFEHEHRHNHEDGHHIHEHEKREQKEHSHIHIHPAFIHFHSHVPDIHHRHKH